MLKIHSIHSADGENPSEEEVAAITAALGVVLAAASGGQEDFSDGTEDPAARWRFSERWWLNRNSQPPSV